MSTTWNKDGLCKAHGLTPNPDGVCACCAIGAPASTLPALTGISLAWAKATTHRMAPGCDLYRAVRK